MIETTSPDWMDECVRQDDLVILGGHFESQMRAIEHNASCLVVCSGLAVRKEVIALADRRDCIVISTPHDVFTVARLMNQSVPIKHFMTKKNLIQFDLEDYVDDVRDVMSKVRHRDFPIVEEDNSYVGMVSRRNLFHTAWMHVYDHFSDVSGKGCGDSKSDCRDFVRGHHFRHADVPVAYLHCRRQGGCGRIGDYCRG